MNSSTLRNTGLAAAAAAVAIGVGVPLALAAPTAAPPSDGQGYVDSTARCTKPDTAVVFGTTETSRVAICQTAGGEFEYRGVRVRDGAKLITPAARTSTDSFVAKVDGVSYTVTPKALSVTAGGNTFRTEAWTDWHAPQSPSTSTAQSTSGTAATSASPTTSGTASPTTSGTAAPTTSGTAAPSTSGTAAPSSTAKSTAAPSATSKPLGPPLQAEVGGDSAG